MPLATGTLAPDFTLLTDGGEPLTLSALRGRPVVLYFYPKDDTPTCTTESCEFRDAFPRFTTRSAVVLGVSPDGVASHAKFRRKFALPFTLLSDTEHAVAEAYGVWQEKRLFGCRYMGVVRTTYVLDVAGRVAHVFEKVSAKGHAAEVLAALDRH